MKRRTERKQGKNALKRFMRSLRHKAKGKGKKFAQKKKGKSEPRPHKGERMTLVRPDGMRRDKEDD